MLTLAIPGVKKWGKSLVALWPLLLFLKHHMHGLGLEKELSVLSCCLLLLNHHPPGTPGQYLPLARAENNRLPSDKFLLFGIKWSFEIYMA